MRSSVSVTWVRTFVLSVGLFCCINNVWSGSGIGAQTDAYIESLEWDDSFHEKSDDFLMYLPEYRDWVRGNDEKRLFLGLIMVGIFHDKDSLPLVRKVIGNSNRINMAVAFSKTMLNFERSESIAVLERYGREKQKAGEAVSIRFLEAIELLSLIRYDGFCSYVKSVYTEEEYQKEALSIAVSRYENLSHHLCNVKFE